VVQRLSRDDLRTLRDAGGVTVVEALLEPHYATPGVMR
jgi:hypothetical protein